MARSVVDGFLVTGGRVLEISPANPGQEINPLNPGVFKPREHVLPRDGAMKWSFPARSVSVVELDCRAV